MKVVAYVRVSTEQQADEGYSLEAQQAKLEAYARAYNLEIVSYEVDAGLSASSLDRPGLQRALDRLGAGAQALLVVKLDRLTRSIRDLADLTDSYFKDGRYSLISVGEHIDTTSASGRLVINILTVVSQWERETICERTSTVMQHMRDAGQYTGGHPPYGWTVNDDGHLVENPEEIAKLARIRDARARGRSIRDIAASFVNLRTGKPFSPTQIARML